MMPVVKLHIVIARLRGVVPRIDDLLEQANLVRLGSENQVFHLFDAVQLRDDFEGVPLGVILTGGGTDSTYLVNQETLSLRGIVHLLRVFRDERVEECVESLVITPLCAENST